MAYNVGKQIVTDGLILHLDAGNTRSYVGAGTTWYDITGNTNDGSLVNSPTFSEGSMTFNGSSNYVKCGTASSLQIDTGTIAAWVRTTSPGTGFRGVITKQNAWGLFITNSVLVTYDWGNEATRTTNINVADGKWKYVAMSFTDTVGAATSNAIIYLNGSNVLTTTVRNLNHNVGVELARGGSASGGATQWLNGSISLAFIYNRALTQSEIQQNFEALRGRYGI